MENLSQNQYQPDSLYTTAAVALLWEAWNAFNTNNAPVLWDALTVLVSAIRSQAATIAALQGDIPAPRAATEPLGREPFNLSPEELERAWSDPLQRV